MTNLPSTVPAYPSFCPEWRVGPSKCPDTPPERFVSASVPGAVQLDWATAEGWPSHVTGIEPLRYAGLEDLWWHYRTTLPEIPDAPDSETWLVLRDVDHAASIFQGGRLIATGGGIGQIIETRLFPSPNGTPLDVVIEPAPKEPGQLGRARARRSTKAAVSYGWDFHPELIPLGLAGEARIEHRPRNHIADTRWKARLSSDLSLANWRAEVTLRGRATCLARLLAPDGRLVWEERVEEASGTLGFQGTVDSPLLWWPSGHGAQHRYTFLCTLLDPAGNPIDSHQKTIGFRRVRLNMAPGQWEEPSKFPKSRSLPPMNLEVNGRRIFAKGANVVGPDIFHGAVSPERWHNVAARAHAANMNILRLWGGAAPPSDHLYDACDELGILVVQEFPLGCNDYPDDPAYLAELEKSALALIARVAHRPCLAVWSGGNELFNAWSGMTDQSHALRLLASLCWQHDPDSPFLPTMPVEGVGHGYYLFRDPQTGVECFELFQKSRNTAYTEFGVPAPASEEAIRTIIPAEELWPVRRDGAWKMHSGSEAWDVEPTSYMCVSTIEHYWGEQGSLAELVAKGQWLSAEGLKAIVEEARRQRPFCGWAMMWCMNEPWPTVANQSLLGYPDIPKPSLAAVAASMRPTLASARIAKFQWKPGELFAADLFLLHDSPSPRPAMRIEAFLSSGTWREKILEWECPAGPPDADLPGPTLRVQLPQHPGPEIILELLSSLPECGSAYRLATALPTDSANPAGPRGLNT